MTVAHSCEDKNPQWLHSGAICEPNFGYFLSIFSENWVRELFHCVTIVDFYPHRGVQQSSLIVYLKHINYLGHFINIRVFKTGVMSKIQKSLHTVWSELKMSGGSTKRWNFLKFFLDITPLGQDPTHYNRPPKNFFITNALTSIFIPRSVIVTWQR